MSIAEILLLSPLLLVSGWLGYLNYRILKVTEEVLKVTHMLNNVTIHVDTFVGQREWFEKMMSDYNVHVAPSSERARGIEKRTVGSYTERNTRSRV